ncbi:MAG: OmpA family protein [Leptospiraceae bacterium]|nr:OmpA family protein [Leptospiraceae bacterium]
MENTGYRVRPLQFWYGIQNSLKELSSRTPSGSESPAIRPENPDQARSDAFANMGDSTRRRMMRPGGVDLARALREDGAATLEGVQFEANATGVQTEGCSVLEGVARWLRLNPDTELVITGHTDDLGSPTHNLRLSRERAENVRELLIELGVAPGRLTAVGLGGTEPLYPNNAEGRIANRRVEIALAARPAMR